MRKNVEKILVISLKHLGDIVTTTCILPIIKSNWPECEIHYLVNEEGCLLIEGNSLIDKIYICPRKVGWQKQVAFWQKLRKERYSLVLDYSENDRGAFWSFASGAKQRVGYLSNKKTHLARNYLNNILLPDRSKVFDKHVTSCHAEYLQKLGCKFENVPYPVLEVTKQARQKANSLLEKHKVGKNEPYSMVHFTARDDIRLWPAENCAKTIDYLSKRVGKVFIGSWPTAKEKNFIEKIQALCNYPVLDLSGQAELDTLMALLETAQLFIGLDSLVGHLAGALGVPTISIFGPASEVHWAPRGEKVKIAHVDKACRPCIVGGCLGNSVSACLQELSFENDVKILIDGFLPEREFKIS